MKKITIKKDLDLNISDFKDDISLFLPMGEHFVYLSKIQKKKVINISIKEDAILHLSILAEKEITDLKINVNIAKNAQLIAYFADFTRDDSNILASINLNEEGASLEWHLASLSSKKDKKNIIVSVYHNARSTFARVDNYGVAKDESKLVFAGTSHILNGMSKSKTHQNAKIMVFDSKSDAVAKPILKIDENDIEASHAAAVGKISDEHLFYLTSRGLSLDDAKMLITLGYLKPIFKGFDNQKVKHINRIIGGRL